MNVEKIKAMLMEHPFTRGLSDEQMQVLASHGRQVSCPANAYLARERHEAHGLYLIQSGRVSIEVHSPRRGSVPIQTLGAGEVFGWSWLIPPHQWHFDAHATEPVLAVMIDGVQLLRLCESDHDLGFQILRRLAEVLAKRLSAARLQMLDESK
jgi:CRP/FNR family cyclic AMP-dependent transcriptional regulator